jgi:hypothetical protein
LAPPPRSCRVSSADPRGLRITAVPASCWPAVHPPMSFNPPSEYPGNSPLPVVSDQAVPPLRFFASSRHLHRGSARHDGFHPIAAFRPRVFATPRRFTPHTTLRAYSIPLARPGFPLQGLSLTRSRSGSSPSPCPLVVTSSLPLLAKRHSRSSPSGPYSPRESVAFSPQLSEPSARYPLGLPLPQGILPSSRRSCFHDPPLTSLSFHTYGTWVRTLLRVFPD